MDKNKKMHVVSEELAVPEVQFDETKEEDLKIENIDHEIVVDYSGAVPEIHVVEKKKKN